MDFEKVRAIDLNDFKKQKPPAKTILIGLLLLLGLLILATSVFTIEPEEVGIVLRFGEYTRTAEPGLHFKLPSPLEQLFKVPVQRQLKEEFGFQTEEAGVRTRYSSRNFENEALMLTGDLNVAVVEWTAQYRVSDARQYLFRVRNVRKTFRDMNEAVMRSVIGDRSVNEVLTIGRKEIADQVEQQLQVLCDQYETGIKVDQIVLQDVNPPDAVKPSFNEVNEAEQERERSINEARSVYNSIIPKARGEALQMIQQAEGYAVDRVNRAKGEVVLFEELLAAYRRAPEVTRRRIYLETMAIVYPQVKQKILLDADLKGVLPLLSLEGSSTK